MESAYDRALSDIGSNGYYQKKFDLIYNILLSGLWSVSYINIVLALVVVPYTCKLPEKTENVTDLAWKTKYIPHETISEKIKFDRCLIYSNPDESNSTNSCNQYQYEKTWYEWTVSSEFDWVCDKEIYIANILAYSKIIELLGSIIFGWFGDTYGRRPTYIISLLLLIVGRSISLLAGRSYIMFLFGCLLSSFPAWSVLQTVTVISVEISSSSRRSTITSMRFASGSIGVAIMPLLYWWLRDWKVFIVVTTAPLVPFLLLSWYMIESPRWEYISGKSEECVKQLKKVARANNKNLKKETETEILTSGPPSSSKSFGPLAFFSSWNLAINTILLMILWAVGSFNYNIQIYGAGEKTDVNPFLQFFSQTISEIPANFIGGWLADHIGRRYTGALSFCVTSTIWLLIAFRVSSSNVWINVWWVGGVLDIIIRISNSVAYYLINLWTMEIYPTCLRQSGMSLGNVANSFGGALAPFILLLGRQIDGRIPGVLLGGFCIIALVSSLLLPETRNEKLPETMEEAQAFGRRIKKYSLIPLKRVSSPCEKTNEKVASNSIP